MLSEEQAVGIVSEYWNTRASDPRGLFALAAVSLTAERDFWVIYGNTKAWVEEGDLMAMSVGIGGFLVDANTGELFIIGSAQGDAEVLQDLRDARAAAGQHYVLAAGTGSGDFQEVTSLRKLLPCGIMQARRLLAPPGRYWFTGSKRTLESHASEFQKIGMPSEVILVADPVDAIPVGYPWDFKWDFRKLAGQIGAGSQMNPSES